MTRVVAYVGLGANLGDAAGAVRTAMGALDGLARTVVTGRSSLWRTAPVGNRDQPDFVNAVCRIETGLAPEALMAALLELERQSGRVRDTGAGGPRTLDLDLLTYGGLRQNRPDVVLPHPRLHERAFVLYPLAELDSELEIPGMGVVRELARHCAGQRAEKL